MRRWIFVIAMTFLAGCENADDGAAGSIGLYSLFDPIAANPSLCGSAAIPFPNNALFSGTTDATLNIPNALNTSFVTAANLTDGFSTTASSFTDVLGYVDYASAADAVLVFEANSGSAPRFLTYGVDYTLQPSIAMAQVSGTGPAAGTCASTGLPAKFLPISEQRSRILIEPTLPLKPSTTYIVAVTKALKSRDGVVATPNEFFPIVNSDTKLCRLSSSETTAELLCSDPNAGRAAASSAPVLALMTPAQMATLETVRRSLVRPTVTALKSAYAALKGSTLDDGDLVIAWSFTTQSTALTLSRLSTSTGSLFVANTTVSTGDLGLGLADTADIYAGTLAVPYYLANSGGDTHSTAPLSTFWASASTLNATNPPALGGAIPCGALAKSTSTTICYPDPSTKTTESIPVIVTVPNANSGQTKPANGWPVVIFQHGITRDRTDMLAIAPTLAAAGFVTVAVDTPLHGLTDATSPFYNNQLFFGSPAQGLMTTERTFNLDLVNNTTGAAGPDGATDKSGTHFVNLVSLITSRDNLRQTEADIMHLARSLAALDFDQNPATLSATDVDETRVHFAGQSLGAITGTTVLGTVDSALINAGVLNVPGGGMGKLLDASASFGPRIAVGLAASFVFEGTDTYETFVRFAQHLIDPADPINYAAAANAGHPLLVTEVIGDAVVPNSAGTTCPSALPPGVGATATSVDAAGTAAASGAAGAALIALCPPLVIPADPPLPAITYQDETAITGYLSGTDALARVMGLSTTVPMGSAPFAAQTSVGADTLVQFAPDTAEHGTLLTPNASSIDGDTDGDFTDRDDTQFLSATCAMQKQTATFLASNGALVPVGGSCP
jgi:hypothetical protein